MALKGVSVSFALFESPSNLLMTFCAYLAFPITYLP